MAISASIKYTDISKSDFAEFLRVFKKMNLEEYSVEERDGFYELYLYWEQLGQVRFDIKLAENTEKIGE